MGRMGFYEYKDVNIKKEQVSFYLECYENFGWKQEKNFLGASHRKREHLKLKRNKEIANKAELTELEADFEKNMDEIHMLEASVNSFVKKWGLFTGMIGILCMTGAACAITAEPPMIGMGVIFGTAAFAIWILTCFSCKKIRQEEKKRIRLSIDARYKEISELCKQGKSLL